MDGSKALGGIETIASSEKRGYGGASNEKNENCYGDQGAVVVEFCWRHKFV